VGAFRSRRNKSPREINQLHMSFLGIRSSWGQDAFYSQALIKRQTGVWRKSF